MAEIQEVSFGDNSLEESILNCPFLKKASVVAAFYPMADEPNIISVLNVLASEKRLLLPKCLNKEDMIFFKIQDLNSDLSLGRFGIMEPNGLTPYEGDIPVFLVPGTKFSRDGGRYGHGMGYYDRFLARFPRATKIGVCFASQMSLEPLELKPHDVLMDKIFIVN